jgi:hypothetical protein
MNSTSHVVHAGAGPTVTIDPSQIPLPVSGSATVSGTVAATQSGPRGVSLTGMPTVALASGSTVALAPGSSVGNSETPTVNVAPGLTVRYSGQH